MARLIPGYAYDIFISYRQNDNKYDGWVTEFVANLNKELEAIIKDGVSVYFDANPHDGLLETHSVDRSLEDKLRCLIFIPILSRTYCDPKSYAWNSEFTAFLKTAQEDSFGLDVKLSSGNVASRVLPVRIHDLNPEDISLVELQIGVIRSIDFIYKSSGVNRPLRSNEDHPQDNINKTYYRDQINKVANAVDEIIRGLKKMHNTPSKAESANNKDVTKHSEDEKSKSLVGSSQLNQKSPRWLIMALSLVLCIIGAFAIYKVISIRKQTQGISKLERSIAVLPFINDSPDKENTYFINGLMEELLNNLQKIKDFRVLSRTSTEQYKGDAIPTIPEIAKKLNVNFIVEGSGQKYGNTFRLRVQLIATHNEKHLWGESFEQEIKETKDIFKIQSQIAQTIAKELKATITPQEKQRIEKISTTNLIAYDFYQRGKDELDKIPYPKFNPVVGRRAEALFHKALEYDSTYAEAYAGLAFILWVRIDRDTTITDINTLNNYLDSMFVLSNIALSYDDKLSNAYVTRGVYYCSKGNIKKTIEELDKAIKYNPNDRGGYWMKGVVYQDVDFVKALENFQKGASLTTGLELPLDLGLIGYTYYNAGFPEKGNDYYLEALKLSGDSVSYSDISFYLIAHMLGDYKRAIEYYENKYLRDTTNATFFDNIGLWHLFLGQYQEALKCYKKYNSLYGQTNEPHMGFIYLQNGYRKEADNCFDRQIALFKDPFERSRHPYSIISANYALSLIYASRGDKVKAYKYLKVFDQDQCVDLEFVQSLKNDPVFNSIKNEPEFQKIVRNMEARYQAEHERVAKWLEEHAKL